MTRLYTDGHECAAAKFHNSLLSRKSRSWATFTTDNEIGTAGLLLVGTFFVAMAATGHAPDLVWGERRVTSAYQQGRRIGTIESAKVVGEALADQAAAEGQSEGPNGELTDTQKTLAELADKLAPIGPSDRLCLRWGVTQSPAATVAEGLERSIRHEDEHRWMRAEVERALAASMQASRGPNQPSQPQSPASS